MGRRWKLALAVVAVVVAASWALTTWRTNYLLSELDFSDARHGTVVFEADDICLFCEWRVDRTDDGGRTWHRRKAFQPKAPAERYRTPKQIGIVDSVSRSVAWGTRETNSSSTIVVTADGGATWRDVSSPCPPKLPRSGQSLAAADARHAWVVCAQPPSGGIAAQAKVVFSTADGGRTWRRLRGRGLPRTGLVGELFFGGTEFGLFRLDQGPLLVTRDGGETWNRVRLSGGGDAWALDVPSGRNGYVMTLRDRGSKRKFELWATYDRGLEWRSVRTWNARVPFPSNY